jgi:iron complex outermembrane receptor protein
MVSKSSRSASLRWISTRCILELTLHYFLSSLLVLPDGQAFQVANPTSDITEISIGQQSPNSIRISVVGDRTLPKTDVVLKIGAFSYSLNPESEAAEEEIVVTGQGEDNYFVPDATTATKTDTPLRDIPASIQVIPRQVIEDQQIRRLNDAVQNVSGVQPDDTFGGQIDRINIRGFSTDVFLQDGIRQSQFSNRALDNIERIEVLKGPASVLYGNLEPGGVVNLVTKEPLPDPFYQAELSIGSYALTLFGRNGSREENRLGFYVQDQIKLLDNLKILVGGRFDLYNRTSVDRLSETTTEDSGQRFSPRGGLVY